MFKKARYVYEIYKVGNFTKAAKKLGVSQPCLSSAIKNIEDKLNAPLFERGSNTAVLTPAGKEYIKVAERIFSLQDAFLNKVENLNTLDCGQLKIGCPSHIMLYVLPKALSEFTAKYPRISVEVLEGSTDALASMLKDGELDVMLDTFDGEAQPSLQIEPLREEGLFLAVPKAMPEAEELKRLSLPQSEPCCGECGTAILPLEALRDKSFVLMKRASPLYHYSKFALQSAGVFVERSPVMFTEQQSTAYELAMLGGHLTFITDTALYNKELEKSMELYSFDGAPQGLIFAAAVKKSKAYTNALQSFIDILKQNI